MPQLIAYKIIQNLRDFFQVNTAEDEARIETVVRILIKARTESNWQKLIMLHQKDLEQQVDSNVPIVQIAVDLEVPVDELERYLNSENIDSFLKYKANRLDSDLEMYERIRKDKRLSKRELRGRAYECLTRIDEVRENLWAARMILGITRQHFQDLRSYVNGKNKTQTGESAEAPASQTKHAINDAICEALTRYTNKNPLFIFEPTQGVGDGTEKYMVHGLVVSTEKKADRFHQAYIKHRKHATELLTCIEDGFAVEDLLKRNRTEKSCRVLMPKQAQDAYEVIEKIKNIGWRFDVIDVDPFREINPMVEAVLPLLADVGVLFVSVNPHPKWNPTKDLARRYRQEHNGQFLENLWMFECCRYMWQATKKGIALIPLVIHKCWRASIQQGIDRLYFLAIRHPSPSGIVLSYVNHQMLDESKISSITSYKEGTVPVIYFDRDIDIKADEPLSVPNIDVIYQYLQCLLKKHSPQR